MAQHIAILAESCAALFDRQSTRPIASSMGAAEDRPALRLDRSSRS